MSTRGSTLTLALVFAGLATVFAQAGGDGTQRPTPYQSGRTTWRRTTAEGTSLILRADTVQNRTYRGNVTIAFPDAKAVVEADEASYDTDNKLLTLSGRVRLTLDRK